MKKKVLCMVVLGCALLAGCNHEHDWKDATCTEAKVCSVCGETDGEALGHTFLRATCTRPELCGRCGEMQGEPLEHNYLMATCAQAPICRMCGVEGGERAAHTEQIVGACAQCHELQNVDVVETLLSKFEELNDLLVLTMNDLERIASAKTGVLGQGAFMSEKNVIFQEAGVTTLEDFILWAEKTLDEVYYKDISSHYKAIYSIYEDAYELCGEYEGLAKLKEKIQVAMERVPLIVPEREEEDLSKYDVLLSQCDQTLLAEASEEVAEVWDQYKAETESFFASVDAYWKQATGVAGLIGNKVSQDWRN